MKNPKNLTVVTDPDVLSRSVRTVSDPCASYQCSVAMGELMAACDPFYESYSLFFALVTTKMMSSLCEKNYAVTDLRCTESMEWFPETPPDLEHDAVTPDLMGMQTPEMLFNCGGCGRQFGAEELNSDDDLCNRCR
jgi:hypothetical protein